MIFLFFKENDMNTDYIEINTQSSIKLNLDIPINKYDIINNGNMGYNGSKNYIKEIDEESYKLVLCVCKLNLTCEMILNF